MSTSLLDLPAEQLLSIADYLEHTDLLNLACVCSRCRDVVETSLWTHIELFPPGYHQWREARSSYCLSDKHRRRYRQPPDRLHHSKYARLRQLRQFGQYKRLAPQWLTKTSDLLSASERRIAGLCSQVKSFSAPLCLENANVWQSLSWLRSLTRLELLVARGPAEPDLLKDAAALPALRHVRLFGHVPSAVITFVLRSAPTIEHFAVGVVSDSEKLDCGQDHFGPQPLRWVPDPAPHMPVLAQLQLCWPSEEDPRSFHESCVHHQEERQLELLADFIRLIISARSSLKHLVLDQQGRLCEMVHAHRPLDDDEDDDDTPLRFPHSVNAKTTAHILRLLDTVEFSRLKKIDFCGSLWGSVSSDTRPKQCKEIGAKCDSRGILSSFRTARECMDHHLFLVCGTEGVGFYG